MVQVTPAPLAQRSTWMSVIFITSTTPDLASAAAYEPARFGRPHTTVKTPLLKNTRRVSSRRGLRVDKPRRL